MLQVIVTLTFDIKINKDYIWIMVIHDYRFT